ncbi:DUF3732 domain-containing protein [Nocardia farcinica]|uniref:DUF3732 domain-containing protein n=1 Tax=Nocardia farcinica TaxID=37329 RepID=UPI000DFBDA29|nr:DUF3732 domain-containing protein [Nocardia farcinica]MBF6250228.1 DUF3732 domain-containing protein [Nocardia farcinica]MBF6440398.1 DUF3732 domain-containing protein [Nocardia farcinica]SUE27688.1 ATPase involved in DNA repair [Nocardia farcinica]
MTFQVQAVIVYGKQPGQVRTVPFRTGTLNIVTGDSRRGKSALLTIIDYCLASSDYPVKAGKVRKYVGVYAVTLVRPGQQLFVARRAPERGVAVSTVLSILSQAPGTPPPPLEELSFTTPLDAGKDFLSDFSGIDRSVRVPAVARAQTITPSIRHALYFCFQGQNEVANPDLLFHSQGKEWRPNTIRGVIPYFLGAVDPEQAALRNRLRLLRRDLSDLEAKIAHVRDLGPASGQARALLTEAVEAGLLPHRDSEPTAVEIASLLRSALEGRIQLVPEANNDNDPLSAATGRRAQLRRAVGQSRTRIADLKRALEENDDFAGQAHEQRARLASLGLMRVDQDASQAAHCPVCESPIASANSTVAAIMDDLERLDSDLHVIGSDTPALQRQLAQEEEQLQRLRAALTRNQDEINEISAGLRALQQEPDDAQRAAHVRGRISLYLDTTAQHLSAPQVEDRREDLQRQIAELEGILSDDTQDDRLTSYLSLISQNIRTKAVALGLDHSETPIRLDVNRLTVVADTNDGPVRLADMGSAENHLGYHIATLLSLHEWFSEHRGPVPRTLILDQPSQVYFPPDYGEPTRDLNHLLNVYRTIVNTTLALDGALQVIVVEHADLADPLFRDHVVERWRYSNDQALVPPDWITEPIDDEDRDE